MNLLLLRGLGREQEHWGSWTEQIQSASMIDKVVCLDLPGTGTEFEKSCPWSIAKVVEDLRCRFSFEGNWGIVGISFGAMVAMEWIYRYPQDFKVLIAMNTSARGVSKISDRLSFEAMAEFPRIFLEGDVQEREARILRLTSNDKEKRVSLLPSWVDIAKRHPVKSDVLIKQLYMASRFKVKELPKIPKLFLVSQRDRLVSARSTMKLAEFFGEGCLVHPTAGHDLTVDSPEWVTERITEFLSN